jgi:hypothetical protein
MIAKSHIAAPDKEYQSAQLEIGRLTGKEWAKLSEEDQKQRKELPDFCVRRFCETFGLNPESGNKGRNMLVILDRLLRGGGADLLDHGSVFSVGTTFLAVVQPYHEKTCKPDHPGVQRLEGMGLVVADFSDWAWYYPGKAPAYGIFCDRHAWPVLSRLVDARLFQKDYITTLLAGKKFLPGPR